MDDTVTFLQETDLFKNLAPPQVRQVVEQGREIAFGKDGVIMREGEEGDTMYIILQGAVEVVKSLVFPGADDGEAEKNKVFTRLDADHHGVFGEIALLERQRRSATVRALEPCRLLEIKRDDFLRMAEENTEIGYRILLNLSRIISTRLRKADEDTIKLTTALSIILKEV